jgi:hypothetical protein
LHRAAWTISREWLGYEAPTAAQGISGDDAKRACQEARRCRFKPKWMTVKGSGHQSCTWY